MTARSNRTADLVTVATLLAAGVVVAWPVFTDGYLTYLDNPSHLAEAISLANSLGSAPLCRRRLRTAASSSTAARAGSSWSSGRESFAASSPPRAMSGSSREMSDENSSAGTTACGSDGRIR